MSQPKLNELFERYLQQQAQAQSAGLAAFDPTGEVTPFEAGPVQPVDPRPAWSEAVAVLPLFQAQPSAPELAAPPHWPALVAAHEPVVALAFCAGNYPQLMRNLHLVLHKAGSLSDLRPSGGTPANAPALLDWATQVADKKQFAQMLLAVGALRLAKHFDAAAEYLKAHAAKVPAAGRAAWANEGAALAWHKGDGQEALRLWQAQASSVPVLFNRGMAALFLGRAADAIQPLADAVAQLPDSGAWHHLGQLYLTLAHGRK